MKNRSVIQPDTLHADTQGQSEPVFGLCRLLGIKLMPRMRGIGGLTFYRPAAAVRYRHIDALFRAEIDWDLIATHARDVFQVVLSIQAGRVTPSVLCWATTRTSCARPGRTRRPSTTSSTGSPLADRSSRAAIQSNKRNSSNTRASSPT